MRQIKLFIFFFVLLSFLMAFSLVSIAGEDLLIIKHQDSPAYNEAAKGTINNLKKNDVSSDQIFEYALKSRAEAITFNDIIDLHPIEELRGIFLIGSHPTEAIMEDGRFNDIPKIFMMVMNPVEKGLIPSVDNPGENLSGVTLDVSVKDKMELIRLIQPNLQRVGIVYSKTSTKIVSNLTQKLKELDIALDSQFIDSPERVPEIFPGLVENVDIFLMTLDETIYKPSVLKYLAENAKKYPICGLTSRYVKLGMLCCVSTEYFSQGQEAVDLFLELEDNFQPVVRAPRMVKLYVNEDTADKLGITIPHSSKILLVD